MRPPDDLKGASSPDRRYADRAAIRELIECSAIWRDSGDWERLAGVWHEGGPMTATWYQGAAEEIHTQESGSLGGRRPRRPRTLWDVDRTFRV